MRKIITLFLVILFLSGCRTITDKEHEDFEREEERHQEQQEEPYIRIPIRK